jgi:8-oxo-dGTP diphosphatase
VTADSAEQPADRVTVVGAAIVADGRVLAALRSAPPRLAGYWEFPGGKVESDETDTAALVRECREELGVDVEVLDRLGTDLPIGGGTATLRVFTARIVAGEPVALEHRELRWIGAADVDALRWLPTNAPLLPALRALLDGHGTG